jgi:hypothetical protein
MGVERVDYASFEEYFGFECYVTDDLGSVG